MIGSPRSLVSARQYAIVFFVLAAIASSYSADTLAQDGVLASDYFARGIFDSEKNLYFWFNYMDGDSYGAANQHVQLGGTQYTFLGNGALLVTGQGLLTDQGNGGAGAGIVRRWLIDGPRGREFILGGGLHWDMTQSACEYSYHQLVGNLELLTDSWAIRFAGYGLVGDTVHSIAQARTAGASGGVFYQGYYLMTASPDYRLDEVAMGGVEVEMAHRIGDLLGNALRRDLSADAAEVFVGYYNLQGELVPQAHGVKGGLRGYLLPDVAANVTVSEDGVFGTSVFAGITWFFGGDGADLPSSLKDKLTLPVQRNQQVAINHVETGWRAPLTDPVTGAPIVVRHANSAAPPGGNGTVERPFRDLPDLQSGSGPHDILFVHADSVFSTQSMVLQNSQRFLGEGVAHFVDTVERGRIFLPQATGGNALPRIVNARRDAVVLANNSEVAGFVIDHAGHDSIRASGIRNLSVHDNEIWNSGRYGISIYNSTSVAEVSRNRIIDAHDVAVDIRLSSGYLDLDFRDNDLERNGVSFNAVINGNGRFRGVLDQNTFDTTIGNGPYHAALQIRGNGSADFTFTNNVVQNASGDGLIIDRGSSAVRRFQAVISGNEFRDNGDEDQHGLSIFNNGGADLDLFDNLFDGNSLVVETNGGPDSHVVARINNNVLLNNTLQGCLVEVRGSSTTCLQLGDNTSNLGYDIRSWVSSPGTLQIEDILATNTGPVTQSGPFTLVPPGSCDP